MLSRKISILILLISLTTSLFFALSFAYFKFESGLDERSKTFSIVENFKGPIADSLWYLDQEILETQIAVLQDLPYIEGLTVSNKNRTFIDITPNTPNQTVQERIIPLIYFDKIKGEAIEVGSLKVFVSFHSLYDELKHDALIIILVSLSQAMIIGALSIIIFQKLIGNHLEHISRFINNIDIGGNNSETKKLILTRPVKAGDELDDIVDNLNHQITLTHDQVSQLKALTQAERNAKEEAEAASQSRSEFLASMSHEIRTPMTAVIGFADMLLQDRINEDSREKARHIKQTAVGLLDILNDILDLSKIDAGKLELEIIAFDPKALVEEIVQLFSLSNKALIDDTVRLTLNFGPDFPELVKSDPTRLRQILMNLVGNALKFTHAGHVTIQCDCDHQNRELTFKVSDTGIGIKQDMLASLFEAFRQADASTSRFYSGTGLGLAICKRLTDIMGGKIWVDSIFGTGSNFYIQVPFAKPTQQDRQVVIQGTPTKESDRGPLSILVAEDNKHNQTIIEHILTHQNHTVRIVPDGFEVVRAAFEQEYDLILMDIRMPGLSGVEATKQIRASEDPRSGVPIIALTADVVPENVEEYFKVGMNDCVAKPIDKDHLFSAIAKATSRGKLKPTALPSSIATKTQPHPPMD